MRIDTLKNHPEKVRETVTLIEDALHYKSLYSYEIDFYPLMNTDNHQNCFIVLNEKDEKVIAHTGIIKRKINLKGNLFDIILIGGVAVSQKARGLGVAKKLLTHIIDTFSNQCTMMILWSDLEDFYKKFSFYQAGIQHQTGVSNFQVHNTNGYQETKLTHLSKTDKERLQQIYTNYHKNCITINRTNHDWLLLEKINSTRLFIKRNSNGDISSYFFYEKGFDLKDIIHEAGTVDSHEKLIQEISSYKWWPPYNVDIVSESRFSAFFKISDIKQMNSFLNILTAGKLSIMKIENENIDFIYKNQKYHFSCENFLRAIFGPDEIKEFQEFKIPIFFSGLDSA